MKPRIVADGNERLRQTPEFQARILELKTSIRQRHATELAKAGFLKRIAVEWRIAREFRRECRKISPSPNALFLAKP